MLLLHRLIAECLNELHFVLDVKDFHLKLLKHVVSLIRFELVHLQLSVLLPELLCSHFNLLSVLLLEAFVHPLMLVDGEVLSHLPERVPHSKLLFEGINDWHFFPFLAERGLIVVVGVELTLSFVELLLDIIENFQSLFFVGGVIQQVFGLEFSNELLNLLLLLHHLVPEGLDVLGFAFVRPLCGSFNLGAKFQALFVKLLKVITNFFHVVMLIAGNVVTAMRLLLDFQLACAKQLTELLELLLLFVEVILLCDGLV